MIPARRTWLDIILGVNASVFYAVADRMAQADRACAPLESLRGTGLVTSFAGPGPSGWQPEIVGIHRAHKLWCATTWVASSLAPLIASFFRVELIIL